MTAIEVAAPTLPHEWDDDACCIHCGHDGAESWHLAKFCGYELVESDRFCSIRPAALDDNTKGAAE